MDNIEFVLGWILFGAIVLVIIALAIKAAKDYFTSKHREDVEIEKLTKR